MKRLLVLFAAMAIVCVFAVSAIGADMFDVVHKAGGSSIKIYGSARFQTFSADKDKGFHGGVNDDRDTSWESLRSTSRFGIKIKSGDISGLLEIRPRDDSFVRHWFGAWDFGGGQLLVGQTWSPLATLCSNQGFEDKILGKYGDISFRQQMIQLKFGGLKVALEKPGTGAVSGSPAGADTDTTIPKIELSYTLSAKPVTFTFGGLYNHTELISGEDTPTEQSYDIDSYAGLVCGKGNFGPVYVAGQVYYAQNFGNSGNGIVGDLRNTPTIVGNDIEDAKSIGYLGVLGFKAGDSLYFEGGYGGVQSEGDLGANSEFEDECSSWYVQAKITLHKGVYLIPEFGQVIDGDYETTANGVTTTVEGGEETYIGAKWQIDF